MEQPQIKTGAQAELLFNRLRKRHKHLKKWARRAETDAYRLYDKDIPEIPLVLDLYGNAVSGALYNRPYEKDENEEALWLLAMAGAVSKALEIPKEHIFLKRRRKLKWRREGGVQYSRLGNEHFYRDVHERDLLFRVNLSDYLDTGLFPDARKRRALIQQEGAGKKVLNLFAYTSTLSLCAAKGGALEVDSVDLSNTYLEWGKVNFALNKLSPGENNAPWRFIRADVLVFLKEAAAKRQKWDIIILDPPSFSNSKKMKETLDIRRDYGELIRLCLRLLLPGGKLFFSTNARGFHPDQSDFPRRPIRDLSPALVDEDFRGKRTSSTWEILAEPPK